MTIARAIAIAALLVGPVLPSRAADPVAVKVPFEILKNGPFLSGHMMVQVKVNGKGPYRLVFDTGAPVNLLGMKIGTECGLTGANVKRPKNVSPMAAANQVLVDRIELGGLVLEGQSAVVFDHPTIRKMAEAFGPIDGLIGFPVFARYRTTIDYQQKEMTFVPIGFEPEDIFQKLMTTMLGRAQARKDGPPVLVPAAQWGMQVEKPADDTEAGINVTSIYPESAAARAGLKAGDRLLTIDGRWTDTVADCFQVAAAIKPGQAVQVSVQRGAAVVKLTVTPTAGF